MEDKKAKIPVVDFPALGVAVRSKRLDSGMGLRSLASALNVSYEPVSRLDAGKSVATDLFASACIWLEIPAETFFLPLTKNK